MMRRTLMLGTPVLALALLFFTPAVSQAQRHGGFHGGYHGGYYGGYHSGYYGHNNWYGHNGYRGGYGYYPGFVYGWGGYSYPYYSSYYSYPSYNYYSSDWNNYPYYYSDGTYTAAPQMSGYQSFYPSDTTQRNPNMAYIRVRVPADAEVFFDGQRVQQSGTDRLFVSPQLERGYKYTYEVKARWTQNGQQVERTRTVSVRPGEETTVDFMAVQ